MSCVTVQWEGFKKALAKIQHDMHHNKARSLWIEILVQGAELGLILAEQHGQQRGKGICLLIPVLVQSSKPSSGQVRNCAVQCWQDKVSAHLQH